MDLTEYNYLWDGSEDGWCLLVSDEKDNNMLVFNQKTRTALIIEIDELNQKVCNRMLANGAPVITGIEEGSCSVEILDED